MKTSQVTAKALEFRNVEIPAKIQKAAPVEIDGEIVGNIIDTPGVDGYLLSFDFGAVRGMRFRATIRECLDEAEKMYNRAATWPR